MVWFELPIVDLLLFYLNRGLHCSLSDGSSKSSLKFNKKNYNMKYHVILGRFKWLINVSPSLEGIRYPRSVYVLSFVCFFLLLLLLFLYSLEKQFGWFLTHISRLHI